MNEEQKALALALLAIPEIREVAEGFRTTKLYFCAEWWVGGAKFCAPNLADETGAVEGWLHRVLERVVGEPVSLQVMSGGTWAAKAASAHVCLPGANWTDLHPTRLDAIVAALRAWVDGR